MTGFRYSDEQRREILETIPLRDGTDDELVIAKLAEAATRSVEARQERRLRDHQAFVAQRERKHGPLKHHNRYYDFPVMTAQETEIRFDLPERIDHSDDGGLGVIYVSSG